MRIQKVVITCLFSLMLFFTAKAQKPCSTKYIQLEDYPFVFVSDHDVTTPPEISDSLFDAAAQGISFLVNRTELQPDDPFISLYRDQLVPLLKEHDMQLRKIYVRGAASPEGPYDNNVRLSRERTQRLSDFLCQELDQCDPSLQPISAQSVTEDYGLLVKLMGEAHDADYDRVRNLWLACNGDEACCKRRLMALNGGRVWRRLVRQYFPRLRQARAILWFSRKQPPVTAPVVEVVPEAALSAAMAATPDTVKTRAVAVKADTVPAVKYSRRHLIAIRTNLLHDLLYVPQFGWANGVNVQLEYYPLRGHYTYNAGFTFTNHRHWHDFKFFQIRDLQLELRRYFKGGGRFIGPYLGLYAEGTVYGIGFSRTKGWEGEGGGGGLTVGYTCRLNRKGSLRLELSASVGAFVTRYDPYIYNHPYVGYDDAKYYYDYFGNAEDFKKRNHIFTWFGPTNAGVHLTYDIVYRKKKPVGYYEQKGGTK